MVLPFIGFTQQDIYVGSALSYGTLGPAQLEGNLLNKRNYSPVIGGQIGFTYRWKDRLAFEVGLGQYRSRIRMNDANFEKEIDGFSLDIRNTQYFWNSFAAISVFYPIGKTDSYFYGKFGFSRNQYKAERLTKSSTFEVSSADIDRTIDFNSVYKPNNFSLIPELGIQHQFFKGNLLSLGFSYTIGRGTSMDSHYQIRDNIKQSAKSDRLQSTGNAFTLNLRFDFHLKHFPKKERIKPIKVDLPLVISPADATIEDSVDIVELADRDLNVRDRIKVKNEDVLVSIWDHQTVDGDRVSLYFNGAWILENYELKKQPHTFNLKLIEGVNILVLHALNLGKIKPNTAALLVKEGDKEHRIVLESNLSQSGTLRINYKKNKEKDEQ